MGSKFPDEFPRFLDTFCFLRSFVSECVEHTSVDPFTLIVLLLRLDQVCLFRRGTCSFFLKTQLVTPVTLHQASAPQATVWPVLCPKAPPVPGQPASPPWGPLWDEH